MADWAEVGIRMAQCLHAAAVVLHVVVLQVVLLHQNIIRSSSTFNAGAQRSGPGAVQIGPGEKTERHRGGSVK